MYDKVTQTPSNTSLRRFDGVCDFPTMKLNDTKSVLIFNRLKRFTAFCPSLGYAALLLGVSPPLVSDACHGRNGSIQAKGYYVRFGGLGDIEDAKRGLIDFDRTHGINARYYPTANISRKDLGLKYEMIKRR